MQLEPIGTFHGTELHRYDAARQATVSHSNTGHIQLRSGQNFEQALSDLEGFSHIWLIFQFHKNQNWKPMVQPPRGERKVGVFASRTPYRPNPLGISCVRLVSIKGLRIEVSDHDLLDGTPILDIKPYLPYADSFPDATTGWLEEGIGPAYTIEISEHVTEQLAWLKRHHVDCIEAFLLQQLAFEPTNAKKKRVRHLQENLWEIAYRTWRVRFNLDNDALRVSLQSVHSGYTNSDLEDAHDPHKDKEVHRAFLKHSETTPKD